MKIKIVLFKRPTFKDPEGILEVRLGQEHFVRRTHANPIVNADQWTSGEARREAFIDTLVDQMHSDVLADIRGSMELVVQ